eukprot:5147077-Amphidinium_carterae.2
MQETEKLSSEMQYARCNSHTSPRQVTTKQHVSAIELCPKSLYLETVISVFRLSAKGCAALYI